MFKFICAYDPDLKRRLHKVPGNAKLMSPDIQNKPLETSASLILRKIKAVLHAQIDTYYAILADECKELSKNEVTAICIRYLHNETLKERAVRFVATHDLTSGAISNKILEILEPLQLEPELCVQC